MGCEAAIALELIMTIDEFEDGVAQLNHDKFWESITDTVDVTTNQ